VLIFFIAGLLYLLCFEHVDNLGAYSIPSETGLLIPSGYNIRPVFDDKATKGDPPCRPLGNLSPTSARQGLICREDRMNQLFLSLRELELRD
jgi:hypothetical protein